MGHEKDVEEYSTCDNGRTWKSALPIKSNSLSSRIWSGNPSSGTTITSPQGLAQAFSSPASFAGDFFSHSMRRPDPSEVEFIGPGAGQRQAVYSKMLLNLHNACRDRGQHLEISRIRYEVDKGTWIGASISSFVHTVVSFECAIPSGSCSNLVNKIEKIIGHKPDLRHTPLGICIGFDINAGEL